MFTMDKAVLKKCINSGLRACFVIALSAVICITGSLFSGCTARTVRIFDGIKEYLVRSNSDNVAAALNVVDLKSDNYKIVSTSVKRNLTSVDIEYLFPVYITVGTETAIFETGKATVKEILTAAGYCVDSYDMVEPSLDTVITKTAYIDFTDVTYVSGSYNEEIPCSMTTVYSTDYDAGTETLQGGANGVKQVNYTEKYVNGIKTETTVDSTVVLSQPTNGKKIVGTKIKPGTQYTQGGIPYTAVNSVSTLTPATPIELDANGIPVNYTKCITARATAYTYTGNNCSTGVAPQPGYIAVNPNYIPYGTRMFIRTPDGSVIYGYAVAADTGGFTKKYPTGVDLFYSTLSGCYSFGVRTVEIYILP